MGDSDGHRPRRRPRYLAAGYVAKAAGFNAGALSLSAIADAATIYFAVAVPETKSEDSSRAAEGFGPSAQVAEISMA